MELRTKEQLLGIKVEKPDEKTEQAVKAAWDGIAKPLDSMGKFEALICRIGAISGTGDVDISKKAVLIFCADNGIVEEGISQSGQDVTALVAESMAQERSSVCKMAKSIGAHTKVIDIGIACEMNMPRIISKKVSFGTRNFRKEPAMTEAETLQAIAAGIEMVRRSKEEGYQLLAMGEMGIGNTTTSSAVAAALLGCPVEDITGRGAGLSTAGLHRKIAVIREALEKYSLAQADAFTVLSTVGGLDLAGMAGMCIGGALYHVPIVMDGVISAVASLAAERMVPGVKEYLIPSHMSKEPAAAKIMEELGLSAVIDANMALGEGTGAVMMFALLDMAMTVYGHRTPFEEVGIETYIRYEQEEKKG